MMKYRIKHYITLFNSIKNHVIAGKLGTINIKGILS